MVTLQPDQYGSWKQFCLASDDAWFWHTSDWLEYTLAYRPERSPQSLSFACVLEGRIVAICPLILETDPQNGVRQLTYGGEATPAPAFANHVTPRHFKTIASAVFEYIDCLAKQHDVKWALFHASPGASALWKNTAPRLYPMTRFGYLDSSLATQVIDLTQDESCLLKNMRKGHLAAIKQAEKLLRGEVLDTTSITDPCFEQYRLLHAKAAGRVTRPLATFQMMLEWIKKGAAILSRASLDGKAVGFALISIYKGSAYYSSGCEDPEFNHYPIGQFLQWKAMLWMKQHQVRHYEIGLQHFASVPNAMTTEKDKNISLFKRGFGGITVPLWQGEKFYDAEYCRQVLGERVVRFAKTMREV